MWAGHDEGVRYVAGQERHGARSHRLPVPTDLDADFALEHEECLFVGGMAVHGTAVAPQTAVFQDRQTSIGGVPTGTNVDQRAEEPLVGSLAAVTARIETIDGGPWRLSRAWG